MLNRRLSHDTPHQVVGDQIGQEFLLGHPAFNGSCLAALVIYGAIYDPPDLNVAYHGNLSHTETLYLQTIATQATHMSFCRDQTFSLQR